MSSNTLNPLSSGSPAEVVKFLQLTTHHELSAEQRESAERIIDSFDVKATIADFVAAASGTPELAGFGERVRECCLPDASHSQVFESEIADVDLRQVEKKMSASRGQ